jgi:creatinine amidohydrolase
VTTPRELLLERLRWPEVGTALESGYTTVLVPCGAVEQHGPHLPLLVDAEHATSLALEVARRLGNALVAPTIRVGCSDHHLAFPGTISVRVGTFAAVHEDYCRSLARHGFKRICCFSCHGGNFGPLRELEPVLDAAVRPGCRVFAFTDLMAFLHVWRDVADAYGVGERVGGHADVAESSVAMLLMPELVRPDLATEGFLSHLDPATIDRLFRDGFRSASASGIIGDARGMLPAIGADCFDRTAALLAADFEARM